MCINITHFNNDTRMLNKMGNKTKENLCIDATEKYIKKYHFTRFAPLLDLKIIRQKMHRLRLQISCAVTASISLIF